MYTDEDIADAVAAGVLPDEVATAFRAHVAKLRRTSAVDEEHFRLVSGFNDIFVVIACLLLLTSVAWIGAAVAPWVGAAATGFAAWLLGEFFVRKRRMALPAIMLLLAFVGSIFMAVLLLGDVLYGRSETTIAIASAAAAVAAWLHWLRFQVPITVASGAAAVVGTLIGLLFAIVPDARAWTNGILLGAGVVVFWWAMQWDMGDPVRQTRKSDVAFWLHLLAAPMLVHPVFSSLSVFGGQIGPMQAVGVVALYVVIAAVSLFVDRRALMVSALAYVLYAFSALLKHYGFVNFSFAITAFVIGSALLLLSAFWHPARALALRAVPNTLQMRLPPSR